MNIISILIFIVIMIMRSREKADQNEKKDKANMPKGLNVFDRKKIETMQERKRNIFSKNVSQNKKKIHKAEIENKKDIEINRQESIENVTKDMGLVQDSEIKDMIHKNEIGSSAITLNKQNIKWGIILSEIIKKPKALQK